MTEKSKVETSHAQDDISLPLTASQTLINKLTEQITNAELRVGEVLTEAGIAKKYGTSRTPAREALKALVQAGLVEHTARRYSVKEVNLNSISELYRIRSALEELLVEELCVPDCREHLIDIQKRLGKGFHSDDGIVSHFHEALVDICPNLELRMLLGAIYTKMSPYRILDGKCRASEVDDDHRFLLTLLLSNRTAEAKSLMREHISKSQHAISGLTRRGIMQVKFHRDI